MIESGDPVPEEGWPISDEGYGILEGAVPDGRMTEVGDPVPDAGRPDCVFANDGE